MILRKIQHTFVIVLIGLAISEAQNSRSYDTSDWVPIAKPSAGSQNHVIEKKATGRVLNLQETPSKSFFPGEQNRDPRQANNQQQYLRETTVATQYKNPLQSNQYNAQLSRQPQQAFTGQDQLQQYYVNQGLQHKLTTNQQNAPHAQQQQQQQQILAQNQQTPLFGINQQQNLFGQIQHQEPNLYQTAPQHVPNPSGIQTSSNIFKQAYPSVTLLPEPLAHIQPELQSNLNFPQQILQPNLQSQSALPNNRHLLRGQHQREQPNGTTNSNSFGLGVQSINHQLESLGQNANNYYKQIDITSTTPKVEKENVQLLYVPLEQLQEKRQHPQRVKAAQPSQKVYHQSQQPAVTDYQNSFQHKQNQLQNIQNDFIQQALEAHKLQLQFQQQPYSLSLATSTEPSTTLKPISRKRKPHQPPLAVYMSGKRDAEVADVLNVLKHAKSIDVQDTIGPSNPKVFVGPANLDPPDGFTKFQLPYLSTLESNRVERKVDQLPFFVAPLNYKTPQGYSKIPFPSPHVGSVVVSHNNLHGENNDQPTNFDFPVENVNQHYVTKQRLTPPTLTTHETYADTEYQPKPLTNEPSEYHIKRQPSRTRGRQRQKGRTKETQLNNNAYQETTPAHPSFTLLDLPHEDLGQLREKDINFNIDQQPILRNDYTTNPRVSTTITPPYLSYQNNYDTKPKEPKVVSNVYSTLDIIPTISSTQSQRYQTLQNQPTGVSDAVPQNYYTDIKNTPIASSTPVAHVNITPKNQKINFDNNLYNVQTTTPQLQTKQKVPTNIPNVYDNKNAGSPTAHPTHKENLENIYSNPYISPAEASLRYQSYLSNQRRPGEEALNVNSKLPADTQQLVRHNNHDIFSIIPPPPPRTQFNEKDVQIEYDLGNLNQYFPNAQLGTYIPTEKSPSNFDKFAQLYQPDVNQINNVPNKSNSVSTQSANAPVIEELNTAVQQPESPRSTHVQNDNRYRTLEDVPIRTKTTTPKIITTSTDNEYLLNYQPHYQQNTRQQTHRQPHRQSTTTPKQIDINNDFLLNYQPQYLQTAKGDSNHERNHNLFNANVEQSYNINAAPQSPVVHENIETQKAQLTRDRNKQIDRPQEAYEYPQSQLSSINHNLPSLINDLQDQSVRQLLAPVLLAPTTTEKNIEQVQNYERVLPTEQPIQQIPDITFNLPTTENIIKYTDGHEFTTATTTTPTPLTYIYTTEPVIETTTKRLRGRNRAHSRYSDKITTHSPRRNPQRSRTQHPSRSKFRQNVASTTPYPPARQTTPSYTTTTDAPRKTATRSRIRTRGRQNPSTASTSVSERINSYNAPDVNVYNSPEIPLGSHKEITPVSLQIPPSLDQQSSHSQLEEPTEKAQLITQSKILSKEEEYLANKYNLTYTFAGNTETPVLPNRTPDNFAPIEQQIISNPTANDIQLAQPFTDISLRTSTISPETTQSYLQVTRQEYATHRATEQAPVRIRGRIRGRARITQKTTTTTTTPKPIKTTTAESTEEDEFYGFIRTPHFKQHSINNQIKLTTQVPYVEPLYGFSHKSSTLEPLHYDDESDVHNGGIRIYTNNEPSPSTPVEFIGEILPKYQPTSTTQYFEVSPDETERYFVSSAAETTTEAAKKQSRGRTRLPSRRTNNEFNTHVEEVSTVRNPQRLRGRGRAHFKLPEPLKIVADDEDVVGGNYPQPYAQVKGENNEPKETETEKPPSFQITIDSGIDADDQLPYSSIHRPKILRPDSFIKLGNHWEDDDKSTKKFTSLAPLTTVETYATTANEPATESVTVAQIEEKTTTGTYDATNKKLGKRKRGFWKLVTQRTVDEFEAAESQNVGVVSINSFNIDEKPYNKEFGFKERKPAEIETTERTTEPIIIETTTTAHKTTKEFLDTIYEMFGFTTSQPTEYATTTMPDIDTTTNKDLPFSTTTATPLMPDEVTDSITTTEHQGETEMATENQTMSKTEYATEDLTTTLQDEHPWNMGVIKTSTSTEISHETEICYKGLCIKSKDMH